MTGFWDSNTGFVILTVLKTLALVVPHPDRRQVVGMTLVP